MNFDQLTDRQFQLFNLISNAEDNLMKIGKDNIDKAAVDTRFKALNTRY